MFCVLCPQGEQGGAGQKGSKGDKGEAVSGGLGCASEGSVMVTPSSFT